MLVAQTADHYERKKRHPRATSLTDSELRNKLDSIISMVGKLNDKIDEQEQRIAVLSRKVSDIECNGTPKKGMFFKHKEDYLCPKIEPCERYACPEHITLFFKVILFIFLLPNIWFPSKKNKTKTNGAIFTVFSVPISFNKIMLFVRDIFIHNIDLPNHNRSFKDPKSSH